MAEVQHIERLKDGGIWVITSKTFWDREGDTWANPIYLARDEAEKFMRAWCRYRAEVDDVTDGPDPEPVGGDGE